MKKIIFILTGAFVLLISYAVLVYYSPIGFDSGIFMYSGRVITEGGMPYLDAWDHKGPLLYVFNAIGLFFFGNKPSGIYIFEGSLLVLSLCIVNGFWSNILLKRKIILVSIFYSLSYISVFQEGNFTETWLLPFMLLTYAFFAYIQVSKINLDKYLAIVIGLSIGVAVLTRVNNGLGLVFILLVFLVKRRTKFLEIILYVFVGFFILVAPIIFWLHKNLALDDCYEQYLSYSFLYTNGVTLNEKIRSAIHLFQTIIFLPVGLTCFLLSFTVLFCGFKKNVTNNSQLLLIYFILFAIDLFSQSLSGRGYLHYAVILLPSMTVLLLLFLVEQPKLNLSFDALKAPMLFFVLVYFIALIPAFNSIKDFSSHGVNNISSNNYKLTAYLKKIAPVDKPVLIHGMGTWLLVSTGLRSVTPITYFLPLIKGFGNTRENYFKDFMAFPPSVIVLTPNSCGLGGLICKPDIEAFDKMDQILNKDYIFNTVIDGYRFYIKK